MKYEELTTEQKERVDLIMKKSNVFDEINSLRALINSEASIGDIAKHYNAAVEEDMFVVINLPYISISVLCDPDGQPHMSRIVDFWDDDEDLAQPAFSAVIDNGNILTIYGL